MGQHTVAPVKKVIPNHNYSIDELKQFINSSDPIVGEWTKTFLGLVQSGLLRCNEDLFILKEKRNQREQALEIIDKYCFIDRIDLSSGFLNSGRTFDNKIKFIRDPRNLSNVEFLAFEYGSCHKDIVKMNCFNLPDIPEKKIPVFVKETPKKIYQEPVIENNNWQYQSPKVEQPYDLKVKAKNQTWFGRNKSWLIPVAATLVASGVTTIVLLNKEEHYVAPIPVIPGGPGGAPTTVVPSTGGPGGANTSGFIHHPVGVGIVIHF